MSLSSIYFRFANGVRLNALSLVARALLPEVLPHKVLLELHTEVPERTLGVYEERKEDAKASPESEDTL